MITAEKGTLLYAVCRDIDEMEPGTALQIEPHVFREIGVTSDYQLQHGISTPRWLLECIVGSAHTHRVEEQADGSAVYYRKDTKP